MSPSTLLDRILWTQLARVVQGAPGEWEPDSASARAIRSVLAETELDPEESGIVERWDASREASRALFDRLLQARVNRAVRAGLRVEVERLGLAEAPQPPKVLIVREGAPEEGPAKSAAGGAREGKTVIEYLAGISSDVASLAPGAKLDELVDLLVLANEEAADGLRSSLGASVSVARAERASEIDLFLAGPTPSIQVFDIERELARLEELLRSAIPPERRPAKSGTWSFGKDLTGESLGGKYRIRRLKGKGAFKTVYEGEDEMLGARVAVAVLNPKGARSPRALEHFQDEAKKLTTLDHENIVRWITFDRTQDGLHYFVMEYLDGEELEETLRREQRLAPKRVARILLQVVAALKRAHKAGKQGSLLHLDLKPENVFVLPPLAPGEPERVKVIDFGIGQHVGAEIRAAERPELRSLYDLPAEELGKSIGSLALPEDDEPAEEAPQPAAGATPKRVQRARGGTLLYASPEQCKHLAGHRDIAPLDGRSDLYSLGVMAFRMLTGQFPFARITTAFEAIENHLKAPPRRVGSLGIRIPRELAAFVDRCLVKDREKRWKDAGEAHEALARIVHPRLSPVKVAVPIVLAGAAGLGALYYTRDPVVHALTLVDPSIENQAGRVVTELCLGPKNPVRSLKLESDAAWSRSGAPELALRDYTSGAGLAGWTARWADAAGATIEIACTDGARSTAGVLELDGGRRSRWRSARIALTHLGPWSIARAGVAGRDPASRLDLDPRQRTLELETRGDPEGALASIEVLHAGERLGRTAPAGSTQRGEHALYAGPALDALFTGEAHAAELVVVARDRAGQEERASLALRIAGDHANFELSTGFVARAEDASALLPFPSETQVLLPGNALRLAADAPARARVFLEPASTPAAERDLRRGEAVLIALDELGIAGASELPGTLRIELDDAPFVERAVPQVRTRNLWFRYSPETPWVQARLVADGFERDLVESGAGGAPNPVNAGARAELVVRTPPGVNLWVEAACAPGEDGGAAFARMRSGGGFHLALDLGAEGLHRIAVRKYVLLAGDERGPLIPPEHDYRVLVDRTAPDVRLGLEGFEPSASGLLVRGDSAQRIVARAADAGLATLGWKLTRPDGTTRAGELSPAEEVVLPALVEHEEAEGRYELVVTASDRAGNTGRAPGAWQVAREGPRLELLEPLASGEERRWALGSGRRWNVRVRAGDANGVASVRARVVYRGEPGRELELRPTSGDLWELPEPERPTANPWWTGQELALEVTARDGAGYPRTLSERGIVPELPRAGELVIAPRAAPAQAMVEVAAGGEYVFGGRPGEGRRPWNVAIARDALLSFYLDAREVTRGEFRAFVADAEGYRDPRWWPAGSAPGAERARRLLAELDGEPERAATGIGWAEASAYAAWRGKRLPTLLEWEFAVRGAEYRTVPASTGPASSAPPGAPRGWPANLCAGAREWTATPEHLSADALDFASDCLRYPERLLAPARASPVDRVAASAALPTRASSHWVAGAAEGEAPSWAARALCPDEPGEPEIGFRCALDRESAQSLLDRGEYVILE